MHGLKRQVGGGKSTHFLKAFFKTYNQKLMVVAVAVRVMKIFGSEDNCSATHELDSKFGKIVMHSTPVPGSDKPEN